MTATIVEKKIEIETLNLVQLLTRSGWEKFTVENIYELANQGMFGLYFKPSKIVGRHQRKSYTSIKKFIKSLIYAQGISDAERADYLTLKDKFIRFVRDYKILLKNHPGYVRLATAMEAEIFRLCENGTVSCINVRNAIHGEPWNNLFGFEFMRPTCGAPKTCISQSYILGESCVTLDDLFVFREQIEAFEAKSGLFEDPIKPKDMALSEKQPQKRQHDLHVLIEKVFRNSTSKSSSAIWNKLRDEMEDEDSIIQEITEGNAKEAKILWISSNGHEQEMKKSTFINVVSRIRTGKISYVQHTGSDFIS